MAKVICSSARECGYTDCVSIRPHRPHKEGCRESVCSFADKMVACIPVEKGEIYADKKRDRQVEESFEDTI